jgi:hypothetical protein
MTVKIKTTFAILGVAALLAPASALAESSNEGYGGPNNVVAGLQQGGGGGGAGPTASAPAKNVSAVAPAQQAQAQAPVQQSSGNTLPFTGAELGLFAAAGGLLLLMGFGLRRLSQRPSQA